MTPGIPAHRFDPTHNHDAAAEWMLDLVDNSPDRLALITMPTAVDDNEVDEQEAWFITVYAIAKNQRPDLSVKLLPALNTGARGTRVVVLVHEHQWVGGECVRGCGNPPPTPDSNP